jgi:hypothetical protein
MPTRSNTNNSRAQKGSETSKCNYTAIQYGNDHGSISFGKVHKKGDVTSSVMLQGKDGRHRFYMDHDGQRPGYTTLTSPGTVAIKCGMDLDTEQDGIFFNAENGDIDIIASNGKIRMVADDIEFVATGGLDQGNIKLTASESIIMNAKKINGTAKNLLRLATPNTCELVANGQMKFVAAVMRSATDACSIKDDKYGHKRKHDENFTVN